MILPGFGLFESPKVDRSPISIDGAKPLEADKSAEIEAAQKKAREREKLRKGRAATIVSGAQGAVEDPLGGAGDAVRRPRSAVSLG